MAPVAGWPLCCAQVPLVVGVVAGPWGRVGDIAVVPVVRVVLVAGERVRVGARVCNYLRDNGENPHVTGLEVWAGTNENRACLTLTNVFCRCG